MKDIKETLLVVAAIILLILSIGLFISKENQKALRKEAFRHLAALRISLNKLQDDFEDKEKLRIKFEKKLNKLSRESASLEVQITQIKKIYEQSEEQLAVVEKDVTSSENEIKDLLSEKEKLTQEVSSAKSEVAKLENRLTILKQTTAALEKHLKKSVRISGIKTKKEPQEATYETKVTAPDVSTRPLKSVPEPSIVHPAIPQALPAGRQVATLSPTSTDKRALLEGEVLVVNREFNFIVINLGRQRGLKEGDCFNVYDGDRLLGEVSIETVRENISAASGGKDLDTYRIRPGNKVKGL